MSATSAQAATAGNPAVSRTAFRPGWFAAVIALHLATYYVVNDINGLRTAADARRFETFLDAWIPYAGWTSYFYYFGDLYILLWAMVVVWRLGDRFASAIRVYAAMILTGGLVQVLVPAHAPWPADFHWLQQTVHDTLSLPPHACFPSMHVALAVLPAAMTFHAFRSWTIRTASAIAAALITASTVTTKEHYALDAIGGLILALVCYAVWRRRSAVDRDGQS